MSARLTVELADGHSGLRAWAIESTGGCGAGLARHLRERGEWVIELYRPDRPARLTPGTTVPQPRPLLHAVLGEGEALAA